MIIESKFFSTKELNFPGGKLESVVLGGRDKFQLAKQAFEAAGIKRVGVIGWGSQGPAQAMNLRESFEGSDIIVEVGLREGSSSFEKARVAGFSEENGTLGEMFDVIRRSDLVILLISDAAQVELYPRIFEAMRTGGILGLSHGFLLGHLRSKGERFPERFSVIGVCPKGMGPSVRRLYEQGREINGAGINCSWASHYDRDGKASDVALAWAIAIGAPFVFYTTLEKEYLSDLTGERGVLLGGVRGLVEALHPHYTHMGMSEESAYLCTVESLTGPISQHIAKRGGLLGLYETLAPMKQEEFMDAYVAAYLASRPLLEEIYSDVESGDEIRSVVRAGNRSNEYPPKRIDRTDMWRAGESVRESRSESSPPSVYGLTAGMYVGMMVAQIDVLVKREHSWSEVCNESIIEAVDSLNPFMHFKGISHMVNNCSTTAQLGARKYAPRFEYAIRQQALPDLEERYEDSGCNGPSCIPSQSQDFFFRRKELTEAFLNHPVHKALKLCSTMRPPVDISVVV